jgi:hypothetical protein
MASDLTTRAHPIRIRLASTAGLRPGVPCVARLTLPPSVARVRLPLACLQRHFPRQQRAEVLVLEGDRPVLRIVQLEPGVGPMVTVAGGLKEGDRVVISDTRGMPPGGPVGAPEASIR